MRKLDTEKALLLAAQAEAAPTPLPRRREVFREVGLMKEYIAREAACAYRPPEKCERRYSTYNLDDAFENGYDEHIKQVEAIPAADVVEVRHGRWIIDKETGDCYCSVCNQGAGCIWYNYCYDCGAKMDGGADGATD